MSIFLKKILTVNYKLMIIILLILTSVVMTTYLISYESAKTQVLDVGGEMFTDVLKDAVGLMDALNEQVEAGKLTLEQAQEMARTYILGPKMADGSRDITKTKMSTNNYMYLWASHPDGTFTMHPFDLEGKNLWDFQVNGRYTVRDSWSNPNKTGYVFEELWKNPGEPMYTFIAYQEYYKPWDWIVGAGGRKEIIYSNRLAGMKRKFLLIGLISLLASTILLLFIKIRSAQELKAEKTQKKQMLEYLAYHDDLTGLPNRRMFYQRLTYEIEKAKIHNQMLAVMFLDLDRFKSINDSMGHTMGDRLLQVVANRIKSCINESEIVARSGGDEFNLLLQDVADDLDAIQMAEKIFKELGRPAELENYEVRITTSIGIAVFPRDGQDIETLMKNADVAMYRAKEYEKHSVQVYHSSMNEQTDERLKLEIDIHKALERNEFFLLYQPRLDAKTHKIVGMEALLRWKHPLYGVISPMKMIPIAEETGAIISIGEWVLRTACKQLKVWQQNGSQHLKVSVNVSVRQFYQGHIVKSIRQVLRETALDPSWLEVEITESTLIHKESTDILQQIKSLGVSIAIDDFGTGYSSLSYLREFDLDVLKIDQSFIRHIETDKSHAALVEAIITLGHNLNMKVVAEGVETKEQTQFLRDQNCDEIQGYYFSKPIPIEEFTTLLQKERSDTSLSIGSRNSKEKQRTPSRDFNEAGQVSE